ncbi:Hemolysin activation/secretion protein [Roseateles sp. YR242]|uniref:ShlB/FhaC/HecB family hemolysin secretion/activation protein n=1 Tax=Roseateles sp. YR242 TaxID=1855305 RepID=UPI0008CD4E14|nr:ShlB/FhaC/HecB family hemolysin secretion/activation protein [Roseateles sp. YR242]SEK82289.1 Hemolysin activation/secretion protein [Roseateles sp. YR242]
MNKMSRHRLSLASAMALISLQALHSAQAQTAPGSGDVLRQVRPPSLPASAPATLPKIGGLPAEAPMQALPGGGTAIDVKSFRIVGNREIGTAELAAQIQGEGGKRYTLAELEVVAVRLTRYYRAKGYFVARAYVPAQELDAGVVTLRVVEGNYGKFVLDNKSLVRDDIVQGLLDDVKKYDIVSLDTLERSMLIINDTPGVKVVRADVMPGEQVGTSDFAVGTLATSRLNGYLLLDNYGSVYTGKTRLSGNLDWNSPTGRGDKLSVSGMLTDGAGLYNGRLAYSALVAPNGTRMELALARTRYELGDAYDALGATGTADSIELGASTPLKRTTAVSVEGGLVLAARRLRDEISATNTITGKRSYSVTASVRARRESLVMGYDGLGTAEASLTGGYLDFRDATAEALDAAGAQTKGSYWKLNAGVSQVLLLPRQFTLTAGLKGQAALNHRNLDGSERMSVSGLSAVVAYPIGELSGDHAALAHLELARALGTLTNVQWSASVFGDYGWARPARVVEGVNSGGRSLGDVGLGLSATMARGGFAKVQVAHRSKGGEPLSEPISKTIVRFQAGWVF